MSSLYYALFSELSSCCANFLAGEESGTNRTPAWRQAYRGLEHRKLKSRCSQKTILNRFPPEIQDFADHVVSMQELRNLSDYDPYHSVSEIDLRLALHQTENVIAKFRSSPEPDRRAFCILALFQVR